MAPGARETEFEIKRAADGIETIRSRINALEGMRGSAAALIAADGGIYGAVREQVDLIQKEEAVICLTRSGVSSKAMRDAVEHVERCARVSGSQRQQLVKLNLAKAQDSLNVTIDVLEGRIAKLKQGDVIDVAPVPKPPPAVTTKSEPPAVKSEKADRSWWEYLTWQPTIPFTGIKIDATGMLMKLRNKKFR